MKAIEWNQSSARHGKIVVKIELRGGRIAVFQLDRRIAVNLPKYCIMHFGLKGQAEEEFFCDFRKLGAISDNKFVSENTQRDDEPPVLIRSRHDDTNDGQVHMLYSIRRTECAEKSWLGIAGWQEKRHIFDIMASGSRKFAVEEKFTLKKKSVFRPVLVAVTATLVIACATVPFVLGSLGPDQDANRTAEAEAVKAYVLAGHDAVVTGNADGQSNKIKASLHRQTARKLSTDKRESAKKDIASSPAVPCTKDMIEKGISCN
jgi:hypothetical protein